MTLLAIPHCFTRRSYRTQRGPRVNTGHHYAKHGRGETANL